MNQQEHQDAVNKRLSLNLLIQGVASHTFLTSHHLVRDELLAIDDTLVEAYDRLAVSLYLNYWIGDIVPIVGRTGTFWRRVRRPDHPFHNHRLLATHGAELAEASKQHAIGRAREKRVRTTPGPHYIHMLRMLHRTFAAERTVRDQLTDVAVTATSRLWGIPAERLEALLTLDMQGFWGPKPDNFATKMMQLAVAGYSNVARRDKGLVVEAKAVTWVLLSHELTKGVAELVCLHGMSGLDDATYSVAVEKADRIDQEAWLMQSGAELWRRLLAVAPKDRTLSQTLMALAKLPPLQLEKVLLAITESHPNAAEHLAETVG